MLHVKAPVVYQTENRKLSYFWDSAHRPTSTINCQKPNFLGYIYVADNVGNLTQLALKAVVLCEITHNDEHRAVQGHLRSPILVPIKGPCANSY